MRPRVATPSRGLRLGPVVLLILAFAGGAWLWDWSAQRRVLGALWNPGSSTRDRLRAIEAWARRGPDGVPQLVPALSAEHPRTRRDAALVLARIGPGARAAAEALRALLDDPQPEVRIEAAFALARVDPVSPQTIARVVDVLFHEEHVQRDAVANLMRELGPPGQAAVLERLDDPRPEARLMAIQALWRVVRRDAAAADAVRRLTTDPDPRVRSSAAVTLLFGRQATFGETARWVNDPEADVASAAVAALQRAGPAAAAALPDLLASLERDPLRNLTAILVVLRTLERAASPAVPLLLRTLEVCDERDAPVVLSTLSVIGAEGPALRPHLLRHTLSRNSDVTDKVAPLLARIDPSAAHDAAALLAERLSTGDRDAVRAALTGLWRLGPLAAPAVPELRELLQDAAADGGRGPREWAAMVLQQIGPGAADAVPEIVALLPELDESSRLTRELIDAVGAIGPAAAPAGSWLLDLLNGQVGSATTRADPRYDAARWRALAALPRIGVTHSEVLERAREALGADDADPRMAAMEALAGLRPRGAVTAAEFAPSFDERHFSLKFTALATIAEVVGPEPEVLARLQAAVHEPFYGFRLAAVVALHRLGPAAEAALPALRSAAEEERNGQTLRLLAERQGSLPERPFGWPRQTVVDESLNLSDVIRQAITRIESGAE